MVIRMCKISKKFYEIKNIVRILPEWVPKGRIPKMEDLSSLYLGRPQGQGGQSLGLGSHSTEGRKSEVIYQ